MKKTLTLLVICLSLNATAALLESDDLNGRLMIMDQLTGSVQGVIQLRKAILKDRVLGDIIVQVNQLVINGKKLSGTCSGNFDLEDQTLTVLCNNLSNVLTLKINSSKEDIASYLKGSFAAGELSYGPRPMQSYKEKFVVDIKNLDLK